VGNLADTRGGLLLELTDAAGNPILVSGPEWRATRADAWWSKTFFFRMNQAAPYQEIFDARKMPAAWHEVGFEDADWRWAEVIRGRVSDTPPQVSPWTRLLPRDIPLMTDDPVLPVAVACTEECLDIMNRVRSEDLSTSLSAVGQPLNYARVEKAEALCTADGTAVLQCSTNHLDKVFDGVYNPCIVLDFGRVITAYPRIELVGVAGGMLDIGYAERLLDGHFNNAIEGQFADRYVMVDGAQTYQPFTWKAFRYLKLRLRSCTEPITLKSVKAIVTTYPYEKQGAFESADDVLNKVFDISRYTLRLCSNEFIMDTPWREQAQWLGDVAGVTLGGIYACFGDTALPGKFLRQAAANQHPTGMISNVSNSVNHRWQSAIPDYSLWWIMGLWNHFMYTGEVRWIHNYYPTALRVFQAHLQYVNAYGLIENMPYWPFVDWADVDKRGESTAYNAIFYGSLDALLQMAAFKHDVTTFSLIEQLMVTMYENFQARLFDPERGCFSDARIDMSPSESALSEKVSEHANMAAIFWGLCDEVAIDAIVKQFYEEKSIIYTEAQPFFTTVVLQALDRVGRFDLALDLIRERWGERMVARGATSVFEEWGMNGSWRTGEYTGFFRTHSHAWSAHPAEFLIRNLIGLSILEPGCGRVKLRPKLTEFDYDVAFPTPRGVIEVKNVSGGVEVTVPEGIHLT
jgi:alpha-L-rhamnosidase